MKLKDMLPESVDYKKFIHYSKPNVINLGTENGWDKETRSVYSYLVTKRTTQTKVTDLNRSGTYREFTFNVKLDGKTYTVQYDMDSSD